MREILTELQFPPTFIGWIMTCVTTVSYRYSINGRLSRFVQAKRGLRQGDPLSPMLFTLVMEFMHRKLLQATSNLDFNYHPRCAKVRLVNLCFADDVLIFCREDVHSVELLMAKLRDFSAATGLVASPTKCMVFFSNTPPEVEDRKSTRLNSSHAQ